MVKVLIKKLSPEVKSPSYKTNGASGMDLIAFVKKPIKILPGETNLVSTGISIAIPEGYEIQIRPRSGLAFKNGITVLNSPGTIDSDYRGEVGVIIINHGSEIIFINHGDRIAQMIVSQLIQAELEEIDSLSITERGEGGFGSTGVKND